MRRDALPQSGYESIDHTADLCIRVWARDVRELFETAANAMAELMLDTCSVGRTRSREVSVSGSDKEDLLVAWLEEILYAFEAEGLAVNSAQVKQVGEQSATGLLLGEDFDSEKHRPRNIIKAVTYHNLEVKGTDDGCEVTIVFDV